LPATTFTGRKKEGKRERGKERKKERERGGERAKKSGNVLDCILFKYPLGHALTTADRDGSSVASRGGFLFVLGSSWFHTVGGLW
jgi:hypothetical protein